MASGELACTYAALILSDDGIAITVRSSPSLSCSFNLKRFLSGWVIPWFFVLAGREDCHDREGGQHQGRVLLAGALRQAPWEAQRWGPHPLRWIWYTPFLALNVLLYVDVYRLEFVGSCMVAIVVDLTCLFAYVASLFWSYKLVRSVLFTQPCDMVSYRNSTWMTCHLHFSWTYGWATDSYWIILYICIQ